MADQYGSDFITIVDEDGVEMNWKFSPLWNGTEAATWL